MTNTNHQYQAIDLTGLPSTEKAPSPVTRKISAKQGSASNLDAPVNPRNTGNNGVQSGARKRGRV